MRLAWHNLKAFTEVLLHTHQLDLQAIVTRQPQTTNGALVWQAANIYDVEC
jgi:hypothetical protein